MRVRQRFGVQVLGLAAVALFLRASPSHAAPIDTVNWAPDTLPIGTGTGTLANGTITVNYFTVVGVGNAGTSLIDNFPTSSATSPVAGGGVTYLSAGVFGVSGVTPSPGATQTITFSTAVEDPILLVNFSDANTSLNFGTLPITFLSSNNAQLAGDVVTFLGSTNSPSDGFAAQIGGTFGPGNPLQFGYVNTLPVFDSIAFTVSADAAPAAPPPAVPEPSTLALLSLGGIALAGWRRWKGRRQRRKTAA